MAYKAFAVTLKSKGGKGSRNVAFFSHGPGEATVHLMEDGRGLCGTTKNYKKAWHLTDEEARRGHARRPRWKLSVCKNCMTHLDRDKDGSEVTTSYSGRDKNDSEVTTSYEPGKVGNILVAFLTLNTVALLTTLTIGLLTSIPIWLIFGKSVSDVYLIIVYIGSIYFNFINNKDVLLNGE